MADDEYEDLIDVGSERGALLSARVRAHPVTRAVAVLAALGVLVAVIATQRHDGGSHRVASGSSSSAVVAPTVSTPTVSASPVVDDSYLYAVPPEDLRAELRMPVCRTGCVTATLAGSQLLRATTSFRGIYPLTGGIISRRGAVIFQSIEARAVPDALVHLVLRRIASSAVITPVVSEHAAGASRTVTVRQDRGGWQLTAQLVVRGSAPPSDAALAWSATTRLPM